MRKTTPRKTRRSAFAQKAGCVARGSTVQGRDRHCFPGTEVSASHHPPASFDILTFAVYPIPICGLPHPYAGSRLLICFSDGLKDDLSHRIRFHVFHSLSPETISPE